MGINLEFYNLVSGNEIDDGTAKKLLKKPLKNYQRKRWDTTKENENYQRNCRNTTKENTKTTKEMRLFCFKSIGR